MLIEWPPGSGQEVSLNDEESVFLSGLKGQYESDEISRAEYVNQASVLLDLKTQLDATMLPVGQETEKEKT